jgi:hypothetical protein
MLQFLVSHILRSSVCVCGAANGGDDDSASFIQMLLAWAVFQHCQNMLRVVIMGPALAVIDPRRPKTPRTAFTPIPRACVAPPMAATTVSPCSFRCSWPALISNFAKKGSGVVLLGPALGVIDPRRPKTPRTAFTPLPRACVAPPMAATTVSPCSFRCSWPALISNFAQIGSVVVILGPALVAIDSGCP